MTYTEDVGTARNLKFAIKAQVSAILKWPPRILIMAGGVRDLRKKEREQGEGNY